jgi:hypothetical protein
VIVRLDYLLVLGILSAATHWLIGRSDIAKPIWSRASGFFERLLACSACSGWWIGLALGLLGLRPVVFGWWTVDVIATGILAVWLTPVFQAVVLWGLDRSRIS